MIYLSESKNEDELVPYLRGMSIRAPIRTDFAFFGVWTGGAPITIGGERKKISDLIQSIEDGRHLQQLQMATEEGYGRMALIIEEPFRRSADTGLVQYRRHGKWKDHPAFWDFARVEAYLLGLQTVYNVIVLKTIDKRETADEIIELWKLFKTAPETHSSLKRFYQPPPPSIRMHGRPTLLRRVAKEFKGVSWERAGAISDEFKTLSAFARATKPMLQSVAGIGPKIADSIISERGHST